MSRRGAKPKVFEQTELYVEGLGHDGRGIAKRDGKLVFVEGALPQERVTVQIRNKRSRFDEAVTLAVLTASPSRTEPQCPHSQVCGGCSLQYMHSEAQLELKQSVLLEQLRHFGGITPQKVTPAMCGRSYHYRRKARLGVRYVAKRDEVLVGFREKRSGFITDIKSCHVLDSRIGNKIQILCELIRSLVAYRTIPQIEVALGDHQTALVFRHMESLADQDIKALTYFGEQQNIEIYLQPAGVDSVHKIWPTQTDARLSYRLANFDLEMHFHPMDFTQVNAEINQSMVTRAVSCLDPQPGDRVLDLFCGLGNFTLPLARSGAEV
ncbi:MAG: 23S rRNA (uracil(1939)-C(5))-methyltransferase RlmD, partial [Pseudomonadales bacterium]|nr:23S rRNA (uracil(1939)-C(5))-methyltransferase RlmD [Pseudomonadales bacterium]